MPRDSNFVIGRDRGRGAQPPDRGMRADLAVFEVMTVGDEAPEHALVERGEGSCSLTVIGGRVRHRRAEQAAWPTAASRRAARC